jgi:hypothetical protein
MNTLFDPPTILVAVVWLTLGWRNLLLDSLADSFAIVGLAIAII